MNTDSENPAAADTPRYEAPRLTIHGSVAELTQSHAFGSVTDRSFPAGTPIQNLTFS